MFRTMVAGDVNMQNQTGHSRSAGYSYLEENVTTMKLHIQDSAKASELDARDLKKTISYRQGPDSDSSTSIIPPEMGCQSPEVEVTSWMKIGM